VDLPKINAELFAKIRTDKDGPEFDDAEAGMVIGRIERCAVASVERGRDQLPDRDEGPRRQGDACTAGMPTAKEMQDHERLRPAWSPRGARSRRGRFWRPSGAPLRQAACLARRYAGAVPIVHKSAAVSEVIGSLAIEETDDPE